MAVTVTVTVAVAVAVTVAVEMSRQPYRGYIIICRQDSITVTNTLGDALFLEYDPDIGQMINEEFLSVQDAQEAIDPIADRNDRTLNAIVSALGIVKDNVIDMERYR